MDYERAKDAVRVAEVELEQAEGGGKLGREARDFEVQDRRRQIDRQPLVVADLERRVGELALRAPFDGMVATIDVQDRDAVAPNAPILTIVDLSQFEVEAQIPETYAEEAAPGTPAVVSYGGRDYPAERLLPQLETALLGVEKGRLVRTRTLVDDRTELHGRDRILVASLNTVMALLVLVTALGIVGLTSFSVAERRKQIGTRRALGADRAAIVRHFLLENWMVTSLGVVLGAGLAYALNFGLVTWVAGARLSPAVVAAGAVALWVIGLGAALGPALRGAQVAPAGSAYAPPPSAGGQ